MLAQKESPVSALITSLLATPTRHAKPAALPKKPTDTHEVRGTLCAA